MDPESDPHQYCLGGLDPDDVVISGMAGRFPDCDSVGELKEKLFRHESSVDFCNMPKGEDLRDVPQCCVRNLDRLDADFFRCGYSLAHKMDPAARIHMEVTYEAIADAGYDANALKEGNIAVYNATSSDYGQKIDFANGVYDNISYIRTINANRATYTLDLVGPSITIDSDCSSSSAALWVAVSSIRSGKVEATVVSGCQLQLHPGSRVLTKSDSLTAERNSSATVTAGPMCRSEAVAAIFVQKAKSARRVYSTVESVKFHSKEKPSANSAVSLEAMEERIMADTLNGTKIDANDIEYVEIDGTEASEGDPTEIDALARCFCRSRTSPLLIGSIKSNIGHTEASSGICGVINAILCFENNCIPPNHPADYSKYHFGPLLEGKVAVVNELTPFHKHYIPVTSIGFGGTIVEALLKKNPIDHRDSVISTSSLPQLVLFPATTEEGVQTVFRFVQGRSDLSQEFFALLHKLSFSPPHLKPVRGFGLFDKGQNLSSQVKNVCADKRPLWFMMTGMGCQWRGMGLQLMGIDAFATSMKRSAEVLRPYGLDLFEVLREDEDHLEQDRNITLSIVGICAIQIALVDVLKHLGLTPDGLIGYSTGELACAYADGCLTAEQTILSAYFRGRSIDSTQLPAGGMATVGMSWEDAMNQCPEGVYPACENADDSVTISGVKDVLQSFTLYLQEKNVFCRLVKCHGYAFHCPFIHPVAPALRSELTKVIPEPRSRSERWISSCYPESEWFEPDCKEASVEYFVHNLLSPVRFKDALQKIPPNAIVVEVGPNVALLPIVRGVVGRGASYLGLMKKGAQEREHFFLESLGKLYIEGMDPKVERLYPPVEFPVPRGTPSISDLIKWDHSQSFHVPKYKPATGKYVRKFLFDKGDSYLLDYKIGGRSVFPPSGHVQLAWEALASKQQKTFQDVAVEVRNLKIHKCIPISPTNATTFFVNILDSSGEFEILESKRVVASGEIVVLEDTSQEGDRETLNDSSDSCPCVPVDDIYKELELQGCECGSAFRNLIQLNVEGTFGLIQWNEKWIPFLESLLTFFIVASEDTELDSPTEIACFKICPGIFKRAMVSKENALPVMYDSQTHSCRCAGVEVSNVGLEGAHRFKDKSTSILEKYTFIPYESNYKPTDKIMSQLFCYLFSCNEYMKKIGTILEMDVNKFLFPMEIKTESDPKRCKEMFPENHSLLTALESFYHDLLSKKNFQSELFSTYITKVGNDVLNNILVNEEPLKIMLEIVLENSLGNLKVIEWNCGFPIVLVPACEVITKYAFPKFKQGVLIADRPLTSNEQQSLDEFGIKILPSAEKQKECRDADLVICSFSSGSLKDLRNLCHSLVLTVKKGGFVLLFQKCDTNGAERFLSLVCGGKEIPVQSHPMLAKVFLEENLEMLCKITGPLGGETYLLRVSSSIPVSNVVLEIHENDFSWAELLKRELAELPSQRVWLVAQDSSSNGIVGLVNSLRKEPGGDRIRCVLNCEKRGDIPCFELEHPFCESLAAKDLTMNVWKDGRWGSFRHIPFEGKDLMKDVEDSSLQVRLSEDFYEFDWIEADVEHVPRESKKLVHVYYSSLNVPRFLASKDAAQQTIGFSGRDEDTWRKVIGIAPAAAAAPTSLWVDPALCLDVPEMWNLEAAATVPAVYTAAYYALVQRAHLRCGERVLVQDGAIGVAAARVALSFQCEVYVVVENKEKPQHLKMPIPDENTGSLSDASYKERIMEKSNGKGIDVILNTFDGEHFEDCMECIAKRGRFVNIKKCTSSSNNLIAIRPKNVTVHSACLDEILNDSSAVDGIMSMLKKGIANGVVKPLPTTVFGRNDVENAFRFLKQGISMNETLLKLRDEKGQLLPTLLPVTPRIHFKGNQVYVVVGDMDDLQLELSSWLLGRGAGHVILASKEEPRTFHQHRHLRKWQKRGADVRISTLNLEQKEEMEQLLLNASRIAPVGGIFKITAVQNSDFMWCRLVEELVASPIIARSRNLDRLSRELCPLLEHFVCFSSVPVSPCDAYANSVVERICAHRKKDGLPGLVVQWGPTSGAADALVEEMAAQSSRSCFEALDILLRVPYSVVASYTSPLKQSVQKDVLT
ncbi:fatty acid synthase [Caerostris darwini]|uniref:Fatty acid synthase n=1 Tax=Caerostris darwini TaxID=1538125 RepID=A0AAV4QZD6_9ARAC|nr:fatty acid synthase [Caerostris darwini]